MLNLHYQYQNRLIMQRLMLWVVLFTTSLGLSAKTFQPYYHSVKVKSGDAISTLLARYELSAHDCDVDKFYALNDMKKGPNHWRTKNTNFPLKFTTTMAKASDYSKNRRCGCSLEIQKFNERLHKKD